MNHAELHETSCGCCRRHFLGVLGSAAGSLTLNFAPIAKANESENVSTPQKGTVTVLRKSSKIK